MCVFINTKVLSTKLNLIIFFRYPCTLLVVMVAERAAPPEAQIMSSSSSCRSVTPDTNIRHGCCPQLSSSSWGLLETGERIKCSFNSCFWYWFEVSREWSHYLCYHASLYLHYLLWPHDSTTTKHHQQPLSTSSSCFLLMLCVLHSARTFYILQRS